MSGNRIRISSMEALPNNFPAFRDSMTEDIGAIYGADAAQWFRECARRMMTALLQQDKMLAWAAQTTANETVGLLYVALDGAHARVSLFHILPAYRDQGIEYLLLEEALDTLKKGGIRSTLCDIAFGVKLQADAMPGVHTCPREVMKAPAATIANTSTAQDASSVPLKSIQFGPAAACMARAYANHPDARLYHEIGSETEAHALLVRSQQGAYGHTTPQWMRALWQGPTCTGVILAGMPFPGMVFITQVCVDPQHQRRGHGSRLIAELAQAVVANNPDATLALGVTQASPARRLYERLGFRRFHTVMTFLWGNH